MSRLTLKQLGARRCIGTTTFEPNIASTADFVTMMQIRCGSFQLPDGFKCATRRCRRCSPSLPADGDVRWPKSGVHSRLRADRLRHCEDAAIPAPHDFTTDSGRTSITATFDIVTMDRDGSLGHDIKSFRDGLWVSEFITAPSSGASTVPNLVHVPRSPTFPCPLPLPRSRVQPVGAWVA